MKIDISLNAEDKEYVKKCQGDDNLVYAYIKRRDLLNFNVGDILIKKNKEWTDDPEDKERWTVACIGISTPAPKKYMVVHKDEFGVCYIRLLKMDGKLGKAISCLATVAHQYIKYEIDPEYVDYILLNEDGKEFNPHEHLKESQERLKKIQDHNNAIMANIDFYGKPGPIDVPKARKFLRSIKPKTEFWVVNENRVSNLDTHKVTCLGYGKDPYEKKALLVEDTDRYQHTLNEWNLEHEKFFLIRPICEKEGLLE